jgi:hypothetical protein
LHPSEYCSESVERTLASLVGFPIGIYVPERGIVLEYLFHRLRAAMRNETVIVRRQPHVEAATLVHPAPKD